MRGFLTGMMLVAGVLWVSSCAPVDPAAGGGPRPAATRSVPGVMHQGGLLDDELNFGRSYQ